MKSVRTALTLGALFFSGRGAPRACKRSRHFTIVPALARFYQSRRLFGPFAAAALGALVAQLPASIARAQDVVVYSNVDNFSGYGDTNGTTPQSDPNARPASSMLLDDLTPISGYAGLPVTSVEFSIYNANTTDDSFYCGLRFYSADGLNGGPGTLLGRVDFDTNTVPAGDITVAPYDAGAPIFTLPTGVVWVGEFFHNGGVTTATDDELANFGEGIFDPPTIGSSSDNIFEVDDTTMYDSNDPTGYLTNFGGDPVANFGFALTVTVPEPASLTCLLAIVSFAGLRCRRVCERELRCRKGK